MLISHSVTWQVPSTLGFPLAPYYMMRFCLPGSVYSLMVISTKSCKGPVDKKVLYGVRESCCWSFFIVWVGLWQVVIPGPGRDLPHPEVLILQWLCYC